MKMHIDNFHFFDKKLLNELYSKDEVSLLLPNQDWKDILAQRKVQFPEHLFIVLNNEGIVFVDNNNFSLFNVEKSKLFINLNSNCSHSTSIYIIHLHEKSTDFSIHSQDLSVEKNKSLIIFHENIIFNKAISSLSIHNSNELYYYNINYTMDRNFNTIFYQELHFFNYSSLFIYSMQNKNPLKNKLDIQINLYETAKISLFSLNYLQKKQLRDDAIEVIHHGKNSFSNIQYLSLNGGKSAVQVNTLIPEQSFHSVTHQTLKHILLDDNAVSYSRPNLMINNPLVVASHGNSIGGFNEADLFYLSQRGISKEKAKHLISHSYIASFCEKTHYYDILIQYFME